jgi:putative spermidine/putrescine transport system permease protein
MADERQVGVPLHWKALDLIEAIVEAVWTRPLRPFTPILWLLPAVTLVAFLAVGMVLMFDASFRELDRQTFRLASTYSLANYIELTRYDVFRVVLLRSIVFAFLVTALTIVIAFPYAYVMVRSPRAVVRKILLFALFLPFFIGQIVRAYCWIILLGRQGLVNGFLELFGLEPLQILFTPTAVVIGMVQYMMPFAVLMLAPALTSIPEEIELAAESLGATWVNSFRYVVLPMARPGLMAAVIVVFTLSLTDYAMPAMMGGGRFDFISNLVYDVFLDVADQGLGAAVVVLLVAIASGLVALIFLAFEYKRLIRG